MSTILSHTLNILVVKNRKRIDEVEGKRWANKGQDGGVKRWNKERIAGSHFPPKYSLLLRLHLSVSGEQLSGKIACFRLSVKFHCELTRTRRHENNKNDHSLCERIFSLILNAPLTPTSMSLTIFLNNIDSCDFWFLTPQVVGNRLFTSGIRILL